ncbi:hypothetical protein [uncultured Erythrobacter sp.]|uniref:hypothetical protein n=1 Tax=uncultured Erythrobacter sp. TaxID=263913 RepID=UPI00261A4B8C|nr:hypothetical protein [uncultured Erythrobacter sp.]
MKTFIPALMFALFSAAGSLAQTNSDTGSQPIGSNQSSEGEIIVEGEVPVSPTERRIQLRKMVTDLITKPRDGRTVATYFEAICPQVVGLPEAETRVIEERISENAEALGANRRNPTKNCKPNLTVIFVPPSAGPPDTWLTDDNDMLRHLLSFQRQDVLSEADPVRTWTINEMRNVDGAPLQSNAGRMTFDIKDVDDPTNVNNPVRLASRLRSNSTSEITGSVVLFELTAAAGKTLTQLADYASMRTFGNSRGLAADANPAADTILTLFRDDDPPMALTTFDRALISKLYDTSRNSLARRYYSNIAGRAFEMEQAEKEQTP